MANGTLPAYRALEILRWKGTVATMSDQEPDWLEERLRRELAEAAADIAPGPALDQIWMRTRPGPPDFINPEPGDDEPYLEGTFREGTFREGPPFAPAGDRVRWMVQMPALTFRLAILFAVMTGIVIGLLIGLAL
jgi:hypothetical protein